LEELREIGRQASLEHNSIERKSEAIRESDHKAGGSTRIVGEIARYEEERPDRGRKARKEEKDIQQLAGTSEDEEEECALN